jgi:hypothetical protein
LAGLYKNQPKEEKIHHGKIKMSSATETVIRYGNCGFISLFVALDPESSMIISSVFPLFELEG